MNKLYFGDNLHVLRKYIRDETVDLIYLDPPCNSNASYNVRLGRKPIGAGTRKARDSLQRRECRTGISMRR